MLNNTIFKSQKDDSQENLSETRVTKLSVADKSAANAPQYDQSQALGRSIRRARRQSWNTGLSSTNWRVTMW